MKKTHTSRDTKCIISMDKLDNENILKIDFNIKNYKVCNLGWKDYDFPTNIVINDKLFLNEEMKNQLIKIFDLFLKEESLSAIATEQTARGFNMANFKDLMGSIISIQESSSAEEAKIWFGCRTKNKAYQWVNSELSPYEYPKGDLLLDDRLHLNKDSIKSLKKKIEMVWASQFVMDAEAKKTIKP